MRDYDEPDMKDLVFEIKKIWAAISALQLAIINEVDPNIIIPISNTNTFLHPQRVFDMWGEGEDD